MNKIIKILLILAGFLIVPWGYCWFLNNFVDTENYKGAIAFNSLVYMLVFCLAVPAMMALLEEEEESEEEN